MEVKELTPQQIIEFCFMDDGKALVEIQKIKDDFIEYHRGFIEGREFGNDLSHIFIQNLDIIKACREAKDKFLTELLHGIAPDPKIIKTIPVSVLEHNNRQYPDEIEKTNITSRLRRILEAAGVKTWQQLADEYFIPLKHSMMDKSPVVGRYNINSLRNFGAQCLDQVHSCLLDRNITYITEYKTQDIKHN